MPIENRAPYNAHSMIGLILCGGQSTRMGTDKGLIKTATGTWAGQAVATVETSGLNSFLSVNKLQYAAYAAVFGANRLIADNDALEIMGPLAGLLSAHQRFPADNLLVLACDMPLIDPALLQQLINHPLKQPANAIVFSNNGAAEPLCGIYTAAGLSAVLKFYQAGQLQRHSMKYILEQIQAVYIQMTAAQQQQFSNINTPGDIGHLYNHTTD